MIDRYREEYILLNEQQKEAVDSIDRNIVTLSPAGTGKTRVIAMRIGKLILSGVDPSKILCLTFTNKSAKEMKERVQSLLGGQASEVTIKTFHSFCFDVIKREAKLSTDISDDFLIFDEDDCREIVSEINIKKYNLKALQYFIDEVKTYSVPHTDKSTRGVLDMYLEENGQDFESQLYWLEDPEKAELMEILKQYGDRLIESYNHALSERHGLDFNDLIINTYRLFEDEEVLSRWRPQYSHINIDEVQDTNQDEYQIILRLGLEKNMGIYGDINQTIYEWRGSEPYSIIKDFKERFYPVKEIVTTKNYRSTRNLIGAASSYLKKLGLDGGRHIESYSAVEGSKITMKQVETITQEGEWIASKLKNNYMDKLSSTAVLTRSNKLNMEISKSLENKGVPCFLVDEFKFFRRQEVKDLTAFLKLALNKYDITSMKRITQKFVKNIGRATLGNISKKETAKLGLRLTDFIDENTMEYDDPYRLLLDELSNGNLVIFDVESTGIDVLNDEIIQIAAIKIDGKGEIDRFERIIRNTIPVASSEEVHGFSDEFLAENGVDMEKSLRDFLEFTKDSVLVAHNIAFDLSIMKSHLSRYDISDLKIKGYYDTLDMARKFYDNLPNYRLDTLSSLVNTEVVPDHNAMNDILATKEVLLDMVDKVKNTIMQRADWILSYKKDFKELYEVISDLRGDIDRLRPYELLEKVIDVTRIRSIYAEESERLENINELIGIFKELDVEGTSPRDALTYCLAFTSLSNSELDRNLALQNKVAVITVHQSKGLEFDTVFMAGLTEGQFPSFMSVNNGDISEELRVFYVAMTRAKKDLYMSWHMRNYVYLKEKSRMIDYIDWQYKEYE